MDERVKGALIKFVDDTKLRKVASAWEESGKTNKRVEKPTKTTTLGRNKKDEI